MNKFFSFSGGRELRVTDDRLDLYSGDWQLFSFPVSSRINLSGREDADTCVRFTGAGTEDNCTVLTWEADGGNWDKKIYIIRVYSDHLTYQINITGQGAPSEILYFRGGMGSPGTAYFTAGYLLCRAEDADYERAKYPVGTEGTLSPSLMSPPPFVFPFWNDYNDDRIGVGLAASAGKNNYERFSVKFIKPATSWFELPLLGYTKIEGEWTSPLIWIGFGKDDISVVEAYSEWAYTEFDYPRYPGNKNVPDWWKKPIFCGWVEQFFLEGRIGQNIKKYSTQENYNEMLERMERVGLKPGTVIIDDKWQTDYGTMMPDTRKWPDLRRFADAQHAAGRHVLLWTYLWNNEGLPAVECTKQRDAALTADPTNPKYLDRLKKQIHYLLSDEPGCMNCDGFKLDYLYKMPRNEENYEFYQSGVYGLEMMRQYYKAFYDFVKEVKPDALVNTSVFHPYFADVCDHIRLHDYNSIQRYTVSVMRFRASVVRAVMPGILIDTDGANMQTGNSQHILYHNREAAKVGIPSLYALSPLTDDELRDIQKVWNDYELKNVPNSVN